MGTTPVYGLPYPEASGLVIQGDDAMKALAEKLEAVIAPAWAAGYQEDNIFIGSGISLDVGASGGSGHFATSGGSLVYGGTNRLFQFSAAVTVQSAGATKTYVQLVHNSTVVQEATHSFVNTEDRTLVLTGLLNMFTGDTLAMNLYALGTGSGTKHVHRWSVVSVSPATA